MDKHNRSLFGFFIAASIATMLIIGTTTSFTNTALSKHSHPGKSSVDTTNIIKSSTKSSKITRSTNMAPSSGIPSSTIGPGNKVVIINFDDSFKTQFLYAKPILDKYGFKATFFEVCGWIGTFPVSKKSWQDLAASRQDGMDIESHTITHAHLNTLSTAELNYQIGQSKQNSMGSLIVVKDCC